MITFGFCVWDILALIILIAVVIAYVIESRNHKKRMDEIEDRANANTRQA